MVDAMPLLPASEVRHNAGYGIFEPTLRDGAYDWRMIGVRTVVVDAGAGPRHGAPSS